MFRECIQRSPQYIRKYCDVDRMRVTGDHSWNMDEVVVRILQAGSHLVWMA